MPRLLRSPTRASGDRRSPPPTERDFKGEALVAEILALVRRFRPLHLSIVGGEPLVRYRELYILRSSMLDTIFALVFLSFYVVLLGYLLFRILRDLYRKLKDFRRSDGDETKS